MCRIEILALDKANLDRFWMRGEGKVSDKPTARKRSARRVCRRYSTTEDV